MPRLARLDAPGVLHHIMGRGIEGNRIFITLELKTQFVPDSIGIVSRRRAIAAMATARGPLLKNKKEVRGKPVVGGRLAGGIRL